MANQIERCNKPVNGGRHICRFPLGHAGECHPHINSWKRCDHRWGEGCRDGELSGYGDAHSCGGRKDHKTNRHVCKCGAVLAGDAAAMSDAYWTARQMLDAPPDSFSAHAWANACQALVQAFGPPPTEVR